MSHVDYKINILHIDFSITVYIIDSLTAVGPQTWLRCAYKRWGGPLGALSLIIVMNMSVIFFFSFSPSALVWRLLWHETIFWRPQRRNRQHLNVSHSFPVSIQKSLQSPTDAELGHFFFLLFTCSYLGVIATKASFFFSWLQLPPSQPSLSLVKMFAKCDEYIKGGYLERKNMRILKYESDSSTLAGVVPVSSVCSTRRGVGYNSCLFGLVKEVRRCTQMKQKKKKKEFITGSKHKWQFRSLCQQGTWMAMRAKAQESEAFGSD